jgi:hypothetical protein
MTRNPHVRLAHITSKTKGTAVKGFDRQAKAIMHNHFGEVCQCCGEYSESCTIHHGIRRSRSWYHHFTPMNWHWICPKCHCLATQDETAYLSKLYRTHPDLVQFILDERDLRRTCKKSVVTLKAVALWLDFAAGCKTYEELIAIPEWQEWMER